MESVDKRNVKVFADDSNTGIDSWLLHICPRKDELVEGPSYIKIFSLSQVDKGLNLEKNDFLRYSLVGQC